VTTLALIALACAALPALLYARNIRHFRPPPATKPSDPLPRISVLIPARNEEPSIRAAVESVLQSEGVELECIVLDDHSEDHTAEVVRAIAATDTRVRLEQSPPLPDGWAGKQHACYTLAHHARHPILTFLDADVRLAPDGLARMAAFLHESKAALVSGFPRQETGTLAEKLVIPLIHFLLLGFLPLARMRSSLQPGLGAGCGQWFMTTRDAYDAVGGHSAVKASFHDGIKLPRAYRAAGLPTDLCDVTRLATCRMYRSATQVWFGLAKNAREGLGDPKLIGFWTLVLLHGQVVPFVLIVWLIVVPSAFDLHERGIVAFTAGLVWAMRFDLAAKFNQSRLGALLHPFGILALLAIQWYATLRAWVGKPVGWKGRPRPATRPGLPPGPPSS
jgi:glycosyltransferase involved in cell wall biosynthesis